MMSPSKLGLFASLALAANAILLPPAITAAELGDNNILKTLTINPLQRKVLVDCPECPVARLHNGVNWVKEETGNTFVIDFNIGPNHDTLSVSGAQLYPPTFDIASQDIQIAQIDAKSEPDASVYMFFHVTGYTFHFDSAETVSEDGMEFLPMTFQVTSIEGRAMELAPITINLLKDSNGNLMIASFDSKKAIDAPLMNGGEECKEWQWSCKWRAILADRIDKFKHMSKGRPGCHKRPHGDYNPMKEETFEGKPPHRFHPGGHHRPPHHMEHNGHHHHHNHNHRMHMFLRRAFFTILVPIFIGIFAGTLTYLIGMALGCLIAITVAKFRGQRYQPIALEDDVEEANVGAKGYEQEYAELPAYDAPPEYQDVLEKGKVEETK